MIKRRLTIRFILQLAFVGMLVLIIAATVALIVKVQLDNAKFSREFASVGLEKLIASSTLDKNGIRFSPELLDQVKRNHGWLQTIDDSGQVEFSYNAPPDVPKRYSPGELVSYWSGEQPFPYDLYMWIEEKHGRSFTILYGSPDQAQPIIKLLNNLTLPAKISELALPAELIQRLDYSKAFVQLLDASGKEIFAYERPRKVPTQYTVQDLAMRTKYNDLFGYQIRLVFNEHNGMTWVVGKSYGGVEAASMEPLPTVQTRIVLTGGITLLAVLLLLFFGFSLWQAHRFGAPMLHTLNWLDNIARARYEEPADRKGLPRSRAKSGRWRRRYRIFSDVMLSLNKLSGTLTKEQQRRKETEQMREDWIAGVSHDLKTPLSSIHGYAHLLAESSYAWSPEEVRKFSGVMLEKAAHMDQLISDLEMTYRLKNGVQPPALTMLEWNSWLAETLKLVSSHPACQQGTIVFVPAEQKEVLREIYPPWLERIIYNLAINALLHNPPGTTLTVSLVVDDESGGKETKVARAVENEPRLKNGISLIFADDGSGMDESTSERLFERYYRGTDTTATTNGSGLGMAIAKGLIEAMGGTIRLETASGMGTRIEVGWGE